MSSAAVNVGNPDDVRETAPLLSEQELRYYKNEKKIGKDGKTNVVASTVVVPQSVTTPTSDVVSRPWSTGLFECCPSCVATAPGWASTDFEICIVGLMAPCVLHGSTSERVNPSPSEFRMTCWAYMALFSVGRLLTHLNLFAPCFSAGTRTAIRRKYNLKGNVECLSDSTGLSMGNISADCKEQMEVASDWAVHWCCHACALCQEAREARRQEAHPSVAYSAMTAPGEQRIV